MFCCIQMVEEGTRDPTKAAGGLEWEVEPTTRCVGYFLTRVGLDDNSPQ